MSSLLEASILCCFVGFRPYFNGCFVNIPSAMGGRWGGGGGEGGSSSSNVKLSSRESSWTKILLNYYFICVAYISICRYILMTEEELMKIAQEFHEKWNLKTYIGAMDGKHILLNPPPNSGSYYFNYKHSFSIVLLAIVDANYMFVY